MATYPHAYNYPAGRGYTRPTLPSFIAQREGQTEMVFQYRALYASA